MLPVGISHCSPSHWYWLNKNSLAKLAAILNKLVTELYTSNGYLIKQTNKTDRTKTKKAKQNNTKTPPISIPKLFIAIFKRTLSDKTKALLHDPFSNKSVTAVIQWKWLLIGPYYLLQKSSFLFFSHHTSNLYLCLFKIRHWKSPETKKILSQILLQ